MKRITIIFILTLLLIGSIAGCDDRENEVSEQMISVESLGNRSSTDKTETSTNLSDDYNPEVLTESDEDLPIEDSSELFEEIPDPQEPDQEESSKPPKVESEFEESKSEVSVPSEEREEYSSIPEVSEEESSTPESSEGEPESEPELQPEAPFDINYWIEYARNYAESVGLMLDNSAVDCWDTPIIAAPTRINLDGDIESRLNRYAYIEGFEWVWIWTEQIDENRYNLYIGYA